MARKKRQPGEPIIIKKYANRRLYNTESSSYITLDDLALIVREGEEVKVVDAKSGDDLTRSVLAQIIVEREAENPDEPMLPLSFLRQIIRFSGDRMQGIIPKYLQSAMETLTQHQDRIQSTFSSANPVKRVGPLVEEMTRYNMKMVQDTFSLFTGGIIPNSANEKDAEIRRLKAQIEALKARVESMSKELP